MQMSESIKEIADAFAKAQSSIEKVVKDNTVNAGKYNYKYADLSAVWQACHEALATQGLSILQSPSTNGAVVTVTTLLMHSSGEWIRGELSLTSGKAGPQEAGSAITYGRRYALMAFLGIAPEDDDGGIAQAATGAAEANRKLQNQHRNTASAAQRQHAAQAQQNPPQQQQPPAQPVSNGQKLREYLKQAGCQSKPDALLVINWLSNNAFTDSDQAMKNEQAAGNLLAVVQTRINDGLNVQQFLQLANAWKVANEAFPVNEGANQ